MRMLLPVIQAWQRFQPGSPEPRYITVLKKKSHSLVCRLAGVGLNGTNVVAKRCLTEKATAERTVYEQVLPRLTLSGLRYYGLLEESDSPFAWIFVEEAQGLQYSADVWDHRVLASEWLATLHTEGMEAAAGLNLPDRGPGCYLAILRLGRDLIERNFNNPALSEDDRGVLKLILSQYDLIERNWARIVNMCVNVPRTFVHGDFYENNIQVRSTSAGTVLLPFDWEGAGWGVPCIDLSLNGLEITTYWSVMCKVWPSLSAEVVQDLVSVGKIFRWVSLVSVESTGLDSEWVGRGMRHMRVYLADTSTNYWGSLIVSGNDLGRMAPVERASYPEQN